MTDFKRPDAWGPEDWATWARRIIVYYSELGLTLEKFVISSQVEMAMMAVHFRYGDGVISLDNKATIRLMGVPVKFTNKLPIHKGMFLCSNAKEAA